MADNLSVKTVLDELLDKPDAVLILAKSGDIYLAKVLFKKDGETKDAVGGSNSLFVALDEVRKHMESQEADDDRQDT